MQELVGDSARGEDWALVRLRVDGDRIVDADAPGLAEDVRGLTLLEAAALEGASPWQRFRRITLPLLMPTTLFISINAMIGAFRLVDHVIAMTRGGPDNATVLLLFYVYQVGFGFWDTGYAAALTVVLLGALGLIALFQFGYADKRVHYR